MQPISAPIKEAFECDLLECNQQPANLDNGALKFEMAPYEIRIFRL
jgi:hypothetical protein